MSADWESVELARLVVPERGISYGIVQPGAPVRDGVPIIRVSDVRGGRIATSSPLRVSTEVERAYGRTRLKGGELLITIVGTVGETAIVPPDLAGWNVARAIAVLPIREDVGAYWVQLGMRSAEAATLIQSRLNTTVQATLNLGDLAKLPILLPPPEERDRIAAVFSALDRKIDLNRRMNDTLEAMVRAIFKDWFVDFGPTRAKMEGRSPYLAPDLWALFPDRFDDEGKPQGWTDASLHSIAVLNPESWTNATRPDRIEYLDLSGAKHGRVIDTATLQRDSFPSRAQRVLRKGDTVVGLVRPGNRSFAFIAEEGLTGSTGFAVLRPKHATDAALLYVTATGQQNVERLARLADGAAYPAISTDAVMATRFVNPGRPLLDLFASAARPLMEKVGLNDAEARTLAATRDLLLPKLMSGEVRITESMEGQQATP